MLNNSNKLAQVKNKKIKKHSLACAFFNLSETPHFYKWGSFSYSISRFAIKGSLNFKTKGIRVVIKL